MNVKQTCTACNIKVDPNNYLRDRIVCKNCYNMKRRENNENSLDKQQQSKNDIFINKNNNKTPYAGFSICGKLYLINHILHQKQEPVFIITRKLNQ